MRVTRIGALLASASLLTACGGSGGDDPPAPPGGGGDPAPGIVLERVFAGVGFSALVSLQQAPNDDSRWFAVQQVGIVEVFDNDPNVTNTAVYLNIAARVNSGPSEAGLLGLAFHPQWPATPELFVSYTSPVGGLTSVVSRFGSNDNGATVDPASEEVLLVVPQDFTNHNGGNIVFGPDGFLYLGLGDGGDGGDPNGRGQDPTNLFGTVVRIDVDGGSPYAIPPGNPFAANTACLQGFTVTGANCPEIFAWGFRNPWRFSFDRSTGDLWLGDVGERAFEEVDRVTVGENYGWNVREGANCFEPPSGCTTAGLTDPVTEYGRSVGQSITGGYVYRGTAIPDLVGWYVFGDFISGSVFAIPADSQPGVAPETLASSTLSISTFAEDVDGELYVVNYGNGEIYRIVDAP